MKTILITGSAGFIGTNLVLRILGDASSSDTQIIGVDNLLTSDRPTINHPRYTFMEADVTHPSTSAKN